MAHARRFRAFSRWQLGLASLFLLGTVVLDAAQAIAQSAGSALRLNDSGDAVVELQRRLVNLGYYDGEITGFYGPQTQDAVIRFQQEMGLDTDGIVGADTETALRNPSDAAPDADRSPASSPPSPAERSPEPPPPQAEPQSESQSESQPEAQTRTQSPRPLVRLGDSGEQIAELQRRLTDLGYYNGTASGTFDRATEEAIQRFQRDSGLTADGIVGAETERALRQPRQAPSASASPAPSPSAPSPSAPSPSASPSPTASPSASPNPPSAASPASPTASPNAASPAAARPIRALRPGDTGAGVSTLQSSLRDRGFYQGNITGTYDNQTQTAVINFQRTRGLTVDGIAGQQVAEALGLPNGFSQGNTQAQLQQSRQEAQQARQEADRAKQEAQQAQLQAEQARLVLSQNLQEDQFSVAELQRQLQQRGYEPGEVNGVLNPNTQMAISEAQQHYGLSEADFRTP